MIYTTLKLRNGDTVSIDNVTGGHYLQAAFMCGPQQVSNSLVVSIYLLAVVAKKNDQCVGIEYIKSLDPEDFNVIAESVNSQSVKIKGNE